MYMEQQLGKFCQLHALNALFGNNVIQPNDMLSFCKEQIQQDTVLGRTLDNGGYCPRDGHFPDMVIDAWLHRYTQPTVRIEGWHH